MTSIIKMVRKKEANHISAPDPVDVHVGARLRARRNVLGLSQDQLGKAAGLTFQQIQKYERGLNRMGASRLFHMAEILNVSVSWFFEDVEALLAPSRAAGFGEAEQEPLDVDPNAQAEAPPLEETRKLIRAWGRIRDARQRKKILELICSLSEDDA